MKLKKDDRTLLKEEFLTVKIRRNDKNRVAEYAERMGISMSSVIRMAINKFLEDN